MAIVRSFASTTRSNGPPLPHTSLAAPTPTRPFTRSFTSSRQHNEAKESEEPISIEEKNVQTENVDGESTETVSTEVPSEPDSTASASLPWYLQSQHTRESSLAEVEDRHRQNIPELPPNPPPLLQELLDYISITAGLDDLNLLDLRHLDPPPALGPKLIMIMGTARSEKHLHVSADRFCRWLRREHRLKANAAGLLGRNELKIKLRRKMKRMKMLANVGGQETEGNIDDGIRTGWICCTVGKIEAHPADTEMPGDDVENFVGFRDIKPGVNVVVQMFTEEKRNEIDLETLWGGVLKTHDRKNTEAEEKLKALDADYEEEGLSVERTQQEMEEEEQAQAQAQAQTQTQYQDTKDPPVAAAPESPKRVPSRQPSDPFPSHEPSPRHWNRSSPTKGGPFPPSTSRDPSRQLRRLHTVGMSPTLVI